jgi:hypothetical protein
VIKPLIIPLSPNQIEILKNNDSKNIYICNARRYGKTLQLKKMIEILEGKS